MVVRKTKKEDFFWMTRTIGHCKVAMRGIRRSDGRGVLAVELHGAVNVTRTSPNVVMHSVIKQR